MNESELRPLTPEGLVPALNPILVKDGEGLFKLKKYFEKKAETERKPAFAIDYETNYTKTFYNRRARALQVGDKNEQYIIDFLHFAQGKESLIAGQGGFKTSSWAKPIIDVLEPAFNSNAFLKIGQNLSFEYEQSWFNFGMPLWNLYSIDIAEKVIWAGLHTFKDLVFYSMARQAARHFKVLVDKSEQKEFDLETELTERQMIYMCFDLRLPIAIMAKQTPILEADNLARVTQIENDAIPYFTDIHLNGIRTDRSKWGALIAEWSAKHREAIEHLDTYFVPVVGPKVVTEENLEPILTEWKDKTVDSQAEIELKELLKATKSKEDKEPIRERIVALVTARKAEAAAARKKYTEMRSKITAAKKIAADCEGNAAINYGSHAQLRKAMLKMPGFNERNLPDTEDSTLKAFNKPMVAHLRDYRTYSKMLETYGVQWITEYEDDPSSEEGWINRFTEKIHSTINQLEADTGRTSSTKPNIQNLPADKRVRACFVADPPDENIRVSLCCEGDTEYLGFDKHKCCTCGQECETRAEDFVIVSVDMSGAELRIIAEESGSPTWIEAFNNDWDVHSMGTELLYPEEWPTYTAKPGDTVEYDGKVKELPPCAYFVPKFYEKKGKILDHQKCECPLHQEARNGNKATNFLLAYGGGAGALAEAIEKPESVASALMEKHEKANPEVWAYLERSGKEAVQDLKSTSRCGRRRLFKEPNWEDATERAREKLFERLKKSKNNTKWVDGKEVKMKLEDCHPTSKQIASALRGMYGSIERQGKNLRIQSLNATIAKLAAGCGFDVNGIPYLWHLLKKYKVKSINFVHDEFVSQCPRRHAEKVRATKIDAIRRAGAEFLKKVVMEAEGRIAKEWQK